MDQNNKENILTRIMSGITLCYVNHALYQVIQPDMKLKYKAECFFKEIIYDLSFEGWIREEDTERILIRYGLWSQEHDSRLKALEKQLEDLKVSCFKSFLQKDKVLSIKKSIERTKKSIDSLNDKRLSLSPFTLENYAQTLKLQYTISACILDEQNNKVYNEDDFWIIDPQLLMRIIQYLNSNQISYKNIRYLARNDPWRGYWSIGKERIFNKSPIEWSEEQRLLVLFSKMYDNAYNHMECPPDKVIEDDDMFDGWLIVQRRAKEKEVMDKQIESIVGKKQKGAGEIFIPVQNEEEAQKIYDMNDLATRMKIKQRNAALAKGGKIAEEKMPDIQQEMKQQAHQNFIKKVKGK